MACESEICKEFQDFYRQHFLFGVLVTALQLRARDQDLMQPRLLQAQQLDPPWSLFQLQREQVDKCLHCSSEFQQAPSGDWRRLETG